MLVVVHSAVRLDELPVVTMSGIERMSARGGKYGTKPDIGIATKLCTALHMRIICLLVVTKPIIVSQ